MFDKIQQVKKAMELKKKVDAIQKALSQEFVNIDEGNVHVVASGDQKIVKLEIDGEENKEAVKAINKALDEAQKKAAKKFQEMGGGLEGLLG